MLDIPKIYEDGIIFRRRQGTPIFPFRKIKETMVVEDAGYVLLTEVPNKMDRVKVTGLNKNFFEVEEDGFLEENWFKVDYVNGWVWFHESLIGRSLNFEYTGTGVFLFPDSRVYHTSDKRFPTVKDKFDDVDRAVLVQKSRVDELIRNVPQPREVIDMRIDHNGKIFKVAKDRIDSEQQKIEEAYFDARGKKYDSLKLRIDSLQLATEESFDDQREQNTKLWASIDVIPGQIAMETGRLEEKMNGEIRKITSSINMVPEQINLKVEELRQDVNNVTQRLASEIDITKDSIDLKVSSDEVLSSINLSKEGVRIAGDKIWLTGETKIENAIIESAHIKSLSASKIRTGILRSENDNTTWNLNTGDFSMKDSHMTLGGRGRVTFTSEYNRIMYSREDFQTGNLYHSGFGVGKNHNERFPFAFMGASRGDILNAGSENTFTGFISNTDARVEADNIGNSVVGDLFQIREQSFYFRQGFRFELYDKVKVFRPIYTNLQDYDIGTPSAMFRNIYARAMRHNGKLELRDSRSGKDGGWLVQTHYAGDGSSITLRGLNGNKYNYALGAKQAGNRITRIYLKNKPNVSSDARLKTDIKNLDLGLDFIKSLEPTHFRFKKTEADLETNKMEYGFIAQQVRDALIENGVDLEDNSILSQDDDGMYALEHEQFIAPMVNSIKEISVLLDSVVKENSFLKSELESIKEEMRGGF